MLQFTSSYVNEPCHEHQIENTIVIDDMTIDINANFMKIMKQRSHFKDLSDGNTTLYRWKAEWMPEYKSMYMYKGVQNIFPFGISQKQIKTSISAPLQVTGQPGQIAAVTVTS